MISEFGAVTGGSLRSSSIRGGLELSASDLGVVSSFGVSNLEAAGGTTDCDAVAARAGGAGGDGTTSLACGGPTGTVGQAGCGAWTTGAGACGKARAGPAFSVGRKLRFDTVTQDADRQWRGASTWNRWPPIEKV